MIGHLYGVGVGPGDPELITLRAAKLIKNADVIAYHSGTAGRSIARTIADPLISGEVIEELLIYPVTTGPIDHPLGYYGAVDDFYDESAERLSKSAPVAAAALETIASRLVTIISPRFE